MSAEKAQQGSAECNDELVRYEVEITLPTNWNLKFSPLVIGLSGKIGSGKTTLADLLIALMGDAVCCNFADALKREVAAMYGIDVQRCYAQEEKNRPISESESLTIGEALQHVGALRRATAPSYWTDRLGEYVDALTNKIVIVGDVRHVNEADFIRARGGLLVRLEGDPGGVRAVSKRNLHHASETDLDHYAGFHLAFDTNKSSAIEVVTTIIMMLIKECRDQPTSEFLASCAVSAGEALFAPVAQTE